MSTPVAYNLSKAMVELAKEKKILSIVRTCAEAFLPQLKISELMLFLAHPQIDTTAKKNLLQKLLPAETPQEFWNFLHLIIDRRRESILITTLETLIDLTIQAEGFEIITLISAQTIDEKTQNQIQTDLETKWGTKLFVKQRQNPNLLGGVVIQRGDRLYDGSLSGQLNKLRTILAGESNLSV